MKPLTIGKVAKLSGVGVETVRYYQRRGLIDQPPQAKSGYRQYPADVVRRIKFIRRGKQLGFSLREIHELLRLRVEPGYSCADIKKRVKDKITDVDRRIEELSKIRKALENLAGECSGRGPTSQCPIMDALDKQER